MKIPTLVYALVNSYGGYLVGSAAEMLYKRSDETPDDFDVIIPPKNWNDASSLFKYATFNGFTMFGGLKFLTNDNERVDVWCMDLGEFYNTLPEKYSGYAMSRGDIFIKRLNEN